jgi:tRNA-2-methylthio-N6-dimethylallyladenosine synthase
MIKKRGSVVIVAGCMAQRIGGDLIDMGAADIVAGPYQSPNIGSIVRAFESGRLERVFISQKDEDFSGRIKLPIQTADNPAQWHRFVTITHGCENRCSYCIVPFVRGRLISFSSDEILGHISSLAALGTKEITLLGQNVNQFGQDTGDIPFHELLSRTAKIGLMERINFLTSHPKDFSENLADVIASHDVISRSVHLPLQSGSDRVLNLMNRKYDMRIYHSIIKSLRERIPDIAVTTDLIVGFPGETDDDFLDTLSAVEEIRFDDAFTYAYSPRSGTPSSLVKENISKEDKIERLQKLISLQRKISAEKLLMRINRTEEAIIEKISRKSPDEVIGKTAFNNMVIIPGTGSDIGKKLKVRINGVSGSSLTGTRIA